MCRFVLEALVPNVNDVVFEINVRPFEIDDFTDSQPGMAQQQDRDTHSFALDKYLVPGKANQFINCVEVTLPADSIESWPDPQAERRSLLYTAFVKLDQAQRYTVGELTVNGDEVERSGDIQYDLDTITSAKDLFDLRLVNLAPDRSST